MLLNPGRPKMRIELKIYVETKKGAQEFFLIGLSDVQPMSRLVTRRGFNGAGR